MAAARGVPRAARLCRGGPLGRGSSGEPGARATPRAAAAMGSRGLDTRPATAVARFSEDLSPISGQLRSACPDPPGGLTMPKLTKNDVLKKAEELKNWGKWGPDDELGVLNYITPQDIVNAARLVKKGKIFRLGLELDENGPQRGIFGGRWNPLHQMLATGTDAVAGKHDVTPRLRYADDAIHLPTQAATQWDALSHVFLVDKMWNGYPATLDDMRGAHKNGSRKFANKMVGRGVLLDVARWKGVACLPDGYSITVTELDATARAQNVAVRRGDFVIVRTGQMEDRLQQ